VISRHVDDHANPRWLERTRSQASSLKESEGASSAARMDTLEAADQVRLTREALQAEERRLMERRLIRWVYTAFAAFVVLLIVYSLFQWIR
jgi:hypothetical protein